MKAIKASFMLYAVGTFLFLSGCNDATTPVYDLTGAHSNLPDTLNTRLLRALEGYNRIKNGLVRTDEQETVAGAVMARHALAGLEMASGDTLLRQLDSILAVKDPHCERQRIIFRSLSASFYKLLQEKQLRSVIVYRQYCPMALNELGGSWLSSSPAVENPYFGKKMLTCGEVTDTLR